LILIYNKIKKKICNSMKGKQNTLGMHHSDESKEKIAKLSRGKTFEERYGKEKAKIIRQKLTKAQKGHIVSEETKRKLSEINKGQISLKKGKTLEEQFGEKKAKEIKEKLRLARLNQPDPRIGKKHTEETKIKISRANKGNKAHLGKKHSKETIQKLREVRAKLILPVKDTSIEIKIRNYLTELGYEFFTHQYMKIEHGYQCDIFVPSEMLVIECDGDYFHFNPEKYNPEDKIFKTGMTAQEKWDLDHSRTVELEEDGYKVLRMWGSEIKAMTLEEFKGKVNTIVAPELLNNIH